MSKFDGSFNNDDSSLLNDPLNVSHISAENLKIPLYLHVLITILEGGDIIYEEIIIYAHFHY